MGTYSCLLSDNGYGVSGNRWWRPRTNLFRLSWGHEMDSAVNVLLGMKPLSCVFFVGLFCAVLVRVFGVGAFGV